MSLQIAAENTPAVTFARSVDEALALLDRHRDDTRLVAGATWLMRAESRGEKLPAMLVSLERVEGAAEIAGRDGGWTVGPMVTHETLAARFGSAGGLRVLGQAAAGSANPGVRRLATIGGNLATADFAAADLVPALLALDATIVVATPAGTERLSVEDFIAGRASRAGPFVIAGVDLDDAGGLSAHARLTMRRAGEYPVAIASVSVRLAADQRIEAAKIAIGSVEPSARRWRELENALAGKRLDLAEIEAAARVSLASLAPRDGVDAPAWYRLEVVPHLVRQAFADISSQVGG